MYEYTDGLVYMFCIIVCFLYMYQSYIIIQFSSGIVTVIRVTDSTIVWWLMIIHCMHMQT